MSSFGVKLLVGCLLISFGVFYGIDVASNGIEQVNGPMTHEHISQPEVKPNIPQETPKKLEEVDTVIPSNEYLAPVASDKFIHQLADAAGEVIQATLHFAVELVVSLFDAMVN